MKDSMNDDNMLWIYALEINICLYYGYYGPMVAMWEHMNNVETGYSLVYFMCHRVTIRMSCQRGMFLFDCGDCCKRRNWWRETAYLSWYAPAISTALSLGICVST